MKKNFRISSWIAILLLLLAVSHLYHFVMFFIWSGWLPDSNIESLTFSVYATQAISAGLSITYALLLPYCIFKFLSRLGSEDLKSLISTALLPNLFFLFYLGLMAAIGFNVFPVIFDERHYDWGF